MITNEQHELLKDIINNMERPDKLAVRLDPVSRTMIVEYDDMDDEWFKEMLELTQNDESNRTPRRANGGNPKAGVRRSG